MKMRTLLLALVLGLSSAGAQAADLQSFGRGSWSKLRAAHDGQPTVFDDVVPILAVLIDLKVRQVAGGFRRSDQVDAG